MAARALTAAEQRELSNSLEGSIKILTDIYQQIVNFRTYGDNKYGRKAHELRDRLVDTVGDDLPLFMHDGGRRSRGSSTRRRRAHSE